MSKFLEEDYYGSLGYGLICPGCGCSNLHHGRVDIYDRDREDAHTGMHLVVDGKDYYTLEDMSGNPSDRRDGMRVTLTCEQCTAISGLTIVQHKGTTYVNLKVIGRRPGAFE